MNTPIYRQEKASPPPSIQVRKDHRSSETCSMEWAARIEKGPHQLWICRQGTAWSRDGFVVEFRVLGKRMRRGHERWNLDRTLKVFIGDDGEKVLMTVLSGDPLFVGFAKWFMGQIEARLPTREEVERGLDPKDFFIEERLMESDFALRKKPERGELSISVEEAEIFRLTGEDLPYVWRQENYDQWVRPFFTTESRPPSC